VAWPLSSGLFGPVSIEIRAKVGRTGDGPAGRVKVTGDQVDIEAMKVMGGKVSVAG
jgi:hypothetical protein